MLQGLRIGLRAREIAAAEQQLRQRVQHVGVARVHRVRRDERGLGRVHPAEPLKDQPLVVADPGARRQQAGRPPQARGGILVAFLLGQEQTQRVVQLTLLGGSFDAPSQRGLRLVVSPVPVEQVRQIERRRGEARIEAQRLV